MGKGSGRRPLKIDKDKFESNWDQIFGKGKKETESCTEKEKSESQKASSVEPPK